MTTPFDELVDRIEAKFRAMSKDVDDEKPLLVMCWTQLRMLAAVYSSMSQYDMKEEMNLMNKPGYYESRRHVRIKSIIDYFCFIDILNRFSRALENRRNDIQISMLNRIRFYRNKVSEHWEDYSESGHVGGQTQKTGEIAIPSVCTSSDFGERPELKKKIDEILARFGLALDIEEPTVFNTMELEPNVEKLYVILESIDPTLSKRRGNESIPDELITKLFQFGFPSPIRNVTKYSDELVQYLSEKLVLNNVTTES